MELYEPRPREMAQEYLEAYILQEGLKANDRLLAERELCELWGMNRSTLRSAISRLVDAGRLSSLQGSGTSVMPRVRRVLQDLQSFTQFAKERGMRPESRLLTFSVIEADLPLVTEFKAELGFKLYQIVRLRCVDSLPLQIETAYIPCSLAPGLEAHDVVSGSLFQILELQYSLVPWQGWEKIGVTAASEAEARYLEIEEEAKVFWLLSKTYCQDGCLLEYCRTVGRGDILELGSTLRVKDTYG